jgi:hypothetical protein
MEAADAPAHYTGHSNAVTGLKNWIEEVGPKFALGQMLLPRSAEIFSLSLPMRVINEAERLIITPALSRASNRTDSRGLNSRGSSNYTPTGASMVVNPVTGKFQPQQPPPSPSAAMNPRKKSTTTINLEPIIMQNNTNININNNINATTPPPVSRINHSHHQQQNTFTPQPPSSAFSRSVFGANGLLSSTSVMMNNTTNNNNNNNNILSGTNVLQQQDVYSPGQVDQLDSDVVAAINSVSSVHLGLGRALALTTAAAMLSRAEMN